ncbi:MAG: hypothetical protein A2677_02235 [Candidatus Komeilibacteria bacterium RIFCSPHIGHO2_01_FULL_52_14]|uniref:Nudix hydrolase domain-containing protein n=1 Tax=Candidatus Komeilibacteria bacterium RIFCSPHIGHO2_01_FULL_52_14 TaxID=1798549 RepID=A0A1G2BHR6_9BACT|nr:MAG: hypothetical protein A2677_02235 [Candidatus Komeilibacteria bacterium RIFCSPHIGHO2_01_FULL_52_14]
MKKFKAKPGQTDYTHIRRAPVINCVVRHNGKILIVQRSAKLNFYPNLWNGISGFLDDNKSIEEKVKEEMSEELGLLEKDIISIKQGKTFEQGEPKYNKIWIVHPVLVEISTDKIKLDWEAQSFKWINPADAKNFDLLPGFGQVLKNVL